jgi:hypothetical protein
MGIRVTLVLLGFALAACGESRSQMLARRLQTVSNVRILVGLMVASSEPFPMKDGALDVYHFVKSGDITRDNYDVLRKPGAKVPTDAEIDAGDYTNFPYERYRGEAKRDGVRPVPLLWEKTPDREGIYVVGMSDGSARAVDQVDFDGLFGK